MSDYDPQCTKFKVVGIEKKEMEENCNLYRYYDQSNNPILDESQLHKS